MSKIVNITSKEDKDQKLQDIANSLEELKDVMAEVIEAYEEENADSRKMDTLTEALDALEDAYEAVNDVLLEEIDALIDRHGADALAEEFIRYE